MHENPSEYIHARLVGGLYFRPIPSLQSAVQCVSFIYIPHLHPMSPYRSLLYYVIVVFILCSASAKYFHELLNKHFLDVNTEELVLTWLFSQLSLPLP